MEILYKRSGKEKAEEPNGILVGLSRKAVCRTSLSDRVL